MFRIPTADFTDSPMIDAREVDFEPSPDDLVLVRDVICYTLSKHLAQHPRLRKFEKSIR